MGLDIYLYRHGNLADTQERETKYQKYSDDLWSAVGDYDKASEEQKDEVRRKSKIFAASLGLDEYGSDKTDSSCIELPSAKYSDHYFKIGYFRSSYNGGGINNVMRNLGLPDLYEIFSRDKEDEYIFQPNWALAVTKATDAIADLKKVPNLRCFKVGWNEFKGSPQGAKITSEAEALAIFMERSKTFRDDDDGFSNSDGEFFPKGLKVFGLISGADKRFFVEEKLPCTYVIMEGENEWYIQALEIVVETIQWVRSQPDKEKYYLHWSS